MKTGKKTGHIKRVKLLKALCVIAFICVLISSTFCILCVRWGISPIEQESDQKSVYVKIPSGTSVKDIGVLLENQGLIRSERLFYYTVRFPKLILKRNAPVVFMSGVYELSPSMNMIEIIDIMADGRQAFVKTVIPEGLTIKKVAKILASNGVCSESNFINSTKNKKILERFGITASNCEGFLFPDTYFFYPDMDSDEVVFLMLENFFSNLSKILGQDVDVSIDYNTLILASIIEREYRVDTEAPLIASVFNNRIKIGMGLESCATIEYIITEILGRPHPDIITYADLKIDSPYNTYKWAALPPGPISNPGIIALTAALKPAESDFFFFTLTDQVIGSHTFSKTLKSHAKATAEFRTKKVN